MTVSLRVATWNIFGGRTWDGARVDLDLTLATLRRLDADVVALQEVDRDLPRSGGVDQARVLAEALGMTFRFAPALLGAPATPGCRGGPGDPAGGVRGTPKGCPGGSGVPRRDGAWPVDPDLHDPGGPAYGIALLSRLPLGQVEIVRLPRRGHEEPRVAQVAEVAVGGGPVTVTGTHLSFVPPSGVAQLRALLRRLGGRGGRRLLLGDLNLGWPLVRVVALPGWRPLVRGGTFRNRPPGSRRPRVQLDHVLTPGRGGLALREPEPPAARGARVVSGPASDHLAVRVELEWPA